MPTKFIFFNEGFPRNTTLTTSHAHGQLPVFRSLFVYIIQIISTKIQFTLRLALVKFFLACARVSRSSVTYELDLSLSSLCRLPWVRDRLLVECEVAKLTNLLENQNEQLEEDNLCDALTQEWQQSLVPIPSMTSLGILSYVDLFKKKLLCV